MNPSFDEVPYGYRGRLYLEIVPRSFAIQVKTGLALNQLRLFTGDARLRDDEIADRARGVPAPVPRLARAARAGS